MVTTIKQKKNGMNYEMGLAGVPYLGHSTPTSTLLIVTPELAADWLKRNSFNRPLRRQAVEKYAREMREGRWRVTHQGIAFDANGRLVDGQHRLHAIVESGESVYMMVTTNVSPETFEVIDVPEHVRSVADFLHIRGHTRERRLVAAIARRMIIRMRTGGGGVSLSKAEEAAFAERHMDVITRVVDVLGSHPLKKAAWLAAFCVADRAGLPGVWDAAERLRTRVYLGAHDPMSTFESRLIRAHGKGERYDGGTYYALAVAALKANAEGRSLRRLYEASEDFAVEIN